MTITEHWTCPLCQRLHRGPERPCSEDCKARIARPAVDANASRRPWGRNGTPRLPVFRGEATPDPPAPKDLPTEQPSEGDTH